MQSGANRAFRVTLATAFGLAAGACAQTNVALPQMSAANDNYLIDPKPPMGPGLRGPRRNTVSSPENDNDEYRGLRRTGVLREADKQRPMLPEVTPHAGTSGFNAIGRAGGSRSWRNNNPGNIEYGPFAESEGAVGSDGRFAIFPSEEAGTKAQEKLLFEGKNYRGLTVGQAIGKWAPSSENNVPAYVGAVTKGLDGVGASTLMSALKPEQRQIFLRKMRLHEGWKPGRVADN